MYYDFYGTKILYSDKWFYNIDGMKISKYNIDLLLDSRVNGMTQDAVQQALDTSGITQDVVPEMKRDIVRGIFKTEYNLSNQVKIW